MKTKKISFQKKVYLSCFTLNLILLAICALVFYYYTAHSLKQNMQDTILSNTSMLLKGLDGILEDTDSILKELQANQTLFSISKNITDAPANYFVTHVPDCSTFQNSFRTILVSRNVKGSLSYISRYYDNVGVSASTGAHSSVPKDKLKNQAELTGIINETAYVTYILPHTDYWDYDETVFSVVRTMRDTYRKYGIMELDLHISVLTDLLSDFENPENYSITLLDAEKNLVYTSNDDMDIEHFYASYKNVAENTDSRTFSSNELSLSCYEVSPMTGWTFILSTSTANYLHSTNQLLIVTAALFFSLFIIMSSFLYLVIHRLTRPLKQLLNQLSHLEPGRNINISQISNDDEITMLTNAIQVFLAEIYDQNQRLTEERKRTLMAHYNAMEAQLNPHFLYNTLAVIGVAGLSSGNTNVSNMCSELANLLRYSLSYTGKSVRLEQEITNACSYLFIMKMRYEDDLIYDWDLDPALNTLLVPKLILQPLLENCFQHGFQQEEYEIPPPWRIKIHSFRDETYWYLSITNNGAPFKKEVIEQLRQSIQQFRRSEYNNTTNMDENLQEVVLRQGYGLENTIMRLNIYYYEQEIFEISTSNTEWTTVTIGGPLKMDESFHCT